MSDREPTRIFFELAELPDDKNAADYKARCTRQLDFQNRLHAAGVSQFRYVQSDLLRPELRWAEIPYGDPLLPALRIFGEGIRVGEYLSFTHPTQTDFRGKPKIYTPSNIKEFN